MKRIAIMFTVLSLGLASCGQGGNNAESTENNNTQQPTNTTNNSNATENDNQMKSESANGDMANANTTVERTVKAVGETMTTMKYDPEQIEVPAGATVKLTLDNTAKSEAMTHNLVVIQLGKQNEVVNAGLKAGSDKDYIPENDPNIIAATSLTKPGGSAEVTFQAPAKKGTYQYICTYPGHTSMKGILLVK